MKAISVKEASLLKGVIKVQGSKNTVLPVIAATILTCGISVIYNCPDITDVKAMCQLLNCLNIETVLDDNVLTIDTRYARYAKLPFEMTGKLRSSILMLGPMLARWHKAEIGFPGGCSIGKRPIDIHLEGLQKMNVDIDCYNGNLECSTFYLQGCEFHLRYPSVGATENLLMAAAGARGRTILRGAATEPEVVELCNYLTSMGVLIDGVGTDVLAIKGSSCLAASDYVNVYDRIVAGTYLLMASAIPSSIRLDGIDDIHYIKNIIKAVSKLGANVIKFDNCLHVQSCGSVLGGDFTTGIYPEFPTDLLPVLIVVLLNAEGGGSVTETVFENRLSVVDELMKLNAHIERDGQKVSVHKEGRLCGHTVRATDLRQGAAMVIAGLLAKGYTTITDISYIERGYEDIVRDLSRVGASISYI